MRSALPAGPLKDGLSGTWLGRTLHPLLTDVPIGAWTSSLILDAVGGRESRRAADRLIAVGILAALPTAATGIADWGDTQPKERRVGLMHGSLTRRHSRCSLGPCWHAAVADEPAASRSA